MFKYVASAVALKCFSAGPVMRGLYRAAGNRVGNKHRQAGVMPQYYLERVKRTVRIAKEYGIVRDGARVIELGTGWLHWEALTLRLFWDIEAICFDVWDNRQLGGLKNYWNQLGGLLESHLDLTAAQLRRAREILTIISKVESFDELYSTLGFKYVVDAEGSLRQFADSSFDLVVSAGVLEHVKRQALPALIADSYRLLKRGGFALQSIDTSDHLSHYDSSVSKKKYLTYSQPVWRLVFENQVQYINRLQRGEWIQLFGSNGFEVIEEDSRQIDISNVNVAPEYSQMKKEDLACTTVRVTLKKN
jgi:hypothetical protein